MHTRAWTAWLTGTVVVLSVAIALGQQVQYYWPMHPDVTLNAEIWSPRVVRGDEMLFAQYGERLGSMQPVKDLVAGGLNVHFEGGKPDEPPLWHVERFVTRVARHATRSERARVWGPDQGVDRRQALRMVTINAARFISEEDKLGSIEKGKCRRWFRGWRSRDHAEGWGRVPVRIRFVSAGCGVTA